MNKSKNLGYLEIVIGILFLITAIISFTSPENTLEAFVVLFGIAAIMKGITVFFSYLSVHTKSGMGLILTLSTSILDVILGVLLLSNMAAGIVALGLLFALWFMIDSIIGLMRGSQIKRDHPALYGVHIAFNLFNLIVGFLMLVDPIISVLTISILVGLYFLVFGMQLLIFAIYHLK